MAWVVYCILNEASSDAFIKTLDMAAEKLNELTGPFDRMKVNTQLILCRYEYWFDVHGSVHRDTITKITNTMHYVD